MGKCKIKLVYLVFEREERRGKEKGREGEGRGEEGRLKERGEKGQKGRRKWGK